MDISSTQHLDLRAPSRARRLTGFGRVTYADSYLYSPESVEQIEALLAMAQNQGMRVVVRGAGRSYGDASMARESVAISLSAMNQILDWDPETHVVTVQAGATMAQVCAFALSNGHWPPAVGGIGAPTIGGAVGMNIHGKNHWMVGAMAEHLVEVQFVSPALGIQTVTAADRAFPAVVGGLGLLGVVTQVKLKLLPVPSACVDVTRTALSSWADHFKGLQSPSGVNAFVSWIDGFSAQGRGIFEKGSYAQATPVDPESPQPGIAANHAWRILKALTNPGGMRLVNGIRFSKARMGSGKTKENLVKFNHPLDQFVEWERAYLPGGLLQFQAFVPDAQAESVLPQVSELAATEGCPSFLTVLKRHRSSNSVLNPYGEGYSLAMDFKLTASNRAKLESLYHRLAEKILSAGGGFYLAKDLLLTQDEFESSLGKERIIAFSNWRDRFDPNRVLTSLQAVRLGL